jgi:aryl-alcohol dehydrogenase-like predicted oxidoreductase
MTMRQGPFVLGTLGIGSTKGQIAGYAPVSDDDAFGVMDAAWELGIRSVDTAVSYGSGCAVERVAAWQRMHGLSFKTTAKLGRPLIDGVIRPDYTIDSLRRELDRIIDAGLTVDTVLIKDPPSGAIISGRWEEWLDPIIAESPELTGGFSSHLLAECRAAAEPQRASVAQIEANVMNWPIAEGCVQHLAGKKFEVWAMQPLAAGILTASTPLARELHPEDWRRMYPLDLLEARQTRSAKIAKQLRNAAPNFSVATSALVFLIADPRIGRVVIGPRLPQHMADVKGALAVCIGEVREGASP